MSAARGEGGVEDGRGVHPEAVAPLSTYGSDAGSAHQHAPHRSWRRHVRVGAVLAMSCAVTLLCLSVSGRAGGASELEDPVVSPPVMGTGGGPTTPVVDGSEVSDPVMGSACTDCPQLDGPTVIGADSSWHNYNIDYNVFGLHVYDGGRSDADAPGALPDDGRNEWENNFDEYDFKPSDRHDGYRSSLFLPHALHGMFASSCVRARMLI